MTRREKALLRSVVVALVLVSASACVGSWSEDAPHPQDQQLSAASYADQRLVGEEEVLYEEEDEFGRPVGGAAGTAGEFLVAVTYVGTILASIILPLFLV
ncbi:MAG: hypothetical protein ACREQ9_27455 [Candidatus Binatia bacterium]